MTGLGLSIPDLVVRHAGGFVPPVAITDMVIEGDSQTLTAPDQSTNRSDFYSTTYADDPANAGVSFHIRAQASRTIGGPAYNGPPVEGADAGSPTGNTLLAHRGDDIAYAPQLLTAMLGSNDMATFSVDNTMSKWVSYAAPVRAAGIKLAVMAPPPYHPANTSYATFNPRWLDYVARLRNPAIRATFADYYIPLGEHPDFRDAALVDVIFNTSDKLHMTPGASVVTSGQYRAYQVYKAAVDTIRDASRAGSGQMYAGAWPANETNLTPGATITRRVLVKGIAHAGLTSGASVSGPAGTTIRLNGGTTGPGVGTNSSNGHAIYNGDVLDIAIPLSESNNTPVSIDLTIGGETRTLTYTTVAQVTPATYAHQDVVNVQPAASTHTFTGLAFDNAGVGLLAVNAQNAPTAVSVGGVAATRLRTRSADSSLSVWTVPITATGARNVVASFGGFLGQSTLSWGVIKNADATPTQVDPGSDGSPGYESQPFDTGGLTVPASGIAVAFFAEYGGASISPATANGGATLIDEGNGTYQSETLGIAVATRTTSGTASFNFAYGPRPRIALVFKAAGT